MSEAQTAQNKGEWSEFYAFLKLLSTGKLRVLDSEDLRSLEVRVASVRKSGKPFVVSSPAIYEVMPGGTAARPRLRLLSPSLELHGAVVRLLAHIKANRGSFRHQPSELVAEALGVPVRSDRTRAKGDLSLSFVRPDSGQATLEHEVSVKSWLGSNPTLFNATKLGTRLIFEVSGLSDASLATLAKSKDSPKATVQTIFAQGGSLTLSRFARTEFRQNLESLRAKDAIAFLVLEHFKKSTQGRTTMEWLLQNSSAESQRPLRAALREFLRASALGMTASKTWDLDMTASDNYLIVDDEGELLCILGRHKLEEHLFRHAYVDTPSTSKHDFGYLYREAGKWEIALNFQIRLDSEW